MITVSVLSKLSILTVGESLIFRSIPSCKACFTCYLYFCYSLNHDSSDRLRQTLLPDYLLFPRLCESTFTSVMFLLRQFDLLLGQLGTDGSRKVSGSPLQYSLMHRQRNNSPAVTSHFRLSMRSHFLYTISKRCVSLKMSSLQLIEQK